jgi:deoxyribodipyrimidine photo-lyase
LRPKLHRLVPDFLTEIPQLTKHPFGDADQSDKNVWQRVRQYIQVDSSVASVDWIPAGEKAAFRMLDRFINHTLSAYDSDRNDPVSDGQSHLSPYFHFGQLSAQRAALSVRDAAVPKAARDAYLEELIVRRELADNFCLYCPSYDAIGAFPEWASRTLTRHRADERPYLYSGEILETAGTHDPIWNACQTEMVVRGKMHGYMRMYWAKKILEWTRAPEEALQTAIRLNDRYELDGRDPNGYAGIAWAIGGVHDRPWGEREIFGTVRYMNDRGIRRKFPMIDTYIRNNMHT